MGNIKNSAGGILQPPDHLEKKPRLLLREKGRRLIIDIDPLFPQLLKTVKRPFFAAAENRTRIGLYLPEKDPHQRCFACAVTADDRMHLAGLQFNIDAGKSRGTGKTLSDAGHL